MSGPPSDELCGFLEERADAIDEARRLPADVVAALRREDLFRIWVPSTLGGQELDPIRGLETIVRLGEANASAAWCVMIAATTSVVAASLPAEHAEAIYGRPDVITGGFAAPAGRAVPVEGGLRVRGAWQWGSGIHDATMIGGGTLVVDEAGSPTPREDGLRAPFVLLEPDQVELLDTWHVLGVRGSGSTDYRACDAFVPEGRWIEIGSSPRVIDRPLYRMPFFAFLAAGVAAVSIGVTRRGVREFVELAAHKRPQGSARLLAERESAQHGVGAADAVAHGAWEFLRSAVADAWASAEAGEEPSIEQRRLIRLASTDATQRSADAVNALHRTGGGEAVYERSGLERCYRDVSVARSHAMVASRIYDLAGRLRLGLETRTSQL